jgi:hypothetical protein
MKKHLLTLIVALGLMAALSTHAAAQMPNMDMSWAIGSLTQLQRQGDARAHATAMAYYNYMLRLRQMGYTGPSLAHGHNGANAASFPAASAAVHGCLPCLFRR